MIAAGQWQPVIRESELPGGKLPETARERETGCPGIVATSHYLHTITKGRWRGTSAAAIARLPGVSMLPFTADGLIQAIDLLRGQRQV